MKFACLIMGDFNPELDRAEIQSGNAQMVGVSTIEQACTVAKELCQNGIGCIELCGAFGEIGAKKIIEATRNKIPVGFVTHLPEQEALYRKTFSKS